MTDGLTGNSVLKAQSEKAVKDMDKQLEQSGIILPYMCSHCGKKCTEKPVIKGSHGLKGFCIDCKKSFYLD